MLINGKIMWVFLPISAPLATRDKLSSQNFLVALAIGYGYPKLRREPGRAGQRAGRSAAECRAKARRSALRPRAAASLENPGGSPRAEVLQR